MLSFFQVIKTQYHLKVNFRTFIWIHEDRFLSLLSQMYCPIELDRFYSQVH